MNPKLRIFAVTVQDFPQPSSLGERKFNAIAPDIRTLVANITAHSVSVQDLGSVDLMLIPTEAPNLGTPAPAEQPQS